MAESECNPVPEQHQNLERYSLEHAAQLWALVFYRRPLYRDDTKERDSLARARLDLRDSGMLQKDQVSTCGGGWGSTGPRASAFLGEAYALGCTPYEAEAAKRALEIRDEMDRSWIDGIDLADLFARHGKHSVIGFNRDQATDHRSPARDDIGGDESSKPGDTDAQGAGSQKKPRQMRDSTLTKVIAALMCAWPGGKRKWPSGKDLEAAAQTAGIAVSDDSIRNAIALAEEEIGDVPPK